MALAGARWTRWDSISSLKRASGRIPIRSALSIAVAPGDENRLRKETPTIAEFFKKNGYTTYFSGKWHLGDRPDAYPTEHGFNEMKLRRLLCRRLFLQRHLEVVSSVVPVVQPGIQQDVR